MNDVLLEFMSSKTKRRIHWSPVMKDQANLHSKCVKTAILYEEQFDNAIMKDQYFFVSPNTIKHLVIDGKK